MGNFRLASCNYKINDFSNCTLIQRPRNVSSTYCWKIRPKFSSKFFVWNELCVPSKLRAATKYKQPPEQHTPPQSTLLLVSHLLRSNFAEKAKNQKSQRTTMWKVDSKLHRKEDFPLFARAQERERERKEDSYFSVDEARRGEATRWRRDVVGG